MAKSKPSSASWSKSTFADDVVILVGASEQRFVVHKQIVCQASRFFDRACSGDWKEAKEGVVRLPEQDPEAAQIFIHWLYTSEVELGESGEEETLEPQGFESFFTRAVRSFILGDAIRSTEVRNAAIDAFSYGLFKNGFWLWSKVTEHWEQLPAGSTFCRLLSDVVAQHATAEVFALIEEHLPHGFISEVAKSALRAREMEAGKSLLKNRGRCFYHEHASDSDKCT